MVVFLFHTQLQFLVIFDLLFSRNGNSWEAVVSISSRSSKLYLIRDECDLVLWQAGFAQHHRQHSFPSSDMGWAAVQGTLFPSIPKPQLVAFPLFVPMSVSAEFAGGDLLKLSPGRLRQHQLLCRFSLGSTPLDIQLQQPLCQQRPERKYSVEQSWWLSCAEINPKVSPWQGLGGLIRQQHPQLEPTFHCISAALQREAHQAPRDWIADSLWDFCGLCAKGKSEAVRRKGGIFIFGKWQGGQNFEMW